jgi:hypothetical protein
MKMKSIFTCKVDIVVQQRPAGGYSHIVSIKSFLILYGLQSIFQGSMSIPLRKHQLLNSG